MNKLPEVLWRPLKEDIVPEDTPVLVYIHNKGAHWMCVAQYNKRDDLFYTAPQPEDKKLCCTVYPDAWAELPAGAPTSKSKKNLWKPKKGNIVPNNVPKLIYGGYKDNPDLICVAEYCPRKDLFLIVPRCSEWQNIWVDYWMDLPPSPGLPPKED